VDHTAGGIAVRKPILYPHRVPYPATACEDDAETMTAPDASRAEDLLVPDLIEVCLPAGGRAVVFSDIHLGERPTPSTEVVAAELTRAIDSWDGPGAVVLAGDVFELLAEPHGDPNKAFNAHPRLASAVSDFAAGGDRRVIVLAGTHDALLAWHPPAIKALAKLGAEVALAVDVVAETGSGPKKVRIEHGHQLDPANTFKDPRNPGETPLGHHIAQDLLPLLRRGGGEWLNSIELLRDPPEVASFVASRLAYRRVARRAVVLALPFIAALSLLVARLGLRLAGRDVDARSLQAATGIALLVGVIGLVAAVAVTVWWAATLRSAFPMFESSEASTGAEPENDAARSRARKLAAAGYVGYISGHTHEPELSDLGAGFYANSGCGGAVVHRRAGRLGLPAAYALAREVAWLELEAGSSLHVRLQFSQQELPTTTALERLATRPLDSQSPKPTTVASWPNGASWPALVDHSVRRKQVRRRAAIALGVAALIDLVTAVIPPFRGALRVASRFVPLAVSQTAAILVAFTGIALLLLARGVRRGQRHAWGVAVLLLAASSLLHVVRGLALFEGLIALVIMLYLLANKRYFQVKEDGISIRRGLQTLVGGAVVAVAAGVAAVELFPGRLPRLSFGKAIEAVGERMVGLDSIPITRRVDAFLSPTMLAVSIGLALAVGWLLFQPVRSSRLSSRPPEAEEQARRLVHEYGGDTLSFFALRDDKRWFFWGDTLVAYAIYQGVCLVSPDPIGPVVEQAGAWAAFRRFADDHGWPVAVMGASEGWLPIYRASGLKDLYVGDEAVVDVRRFRLDGGRNKGLRQAVNRIAKYGYRIEFHDPAHISPQLEASLRALMTESRRGDVERGFSMTLSRIFNPADEGLLLAVCFGPDDVPAAFCHFVPSDAIKGYSLDLMRRSEGDHPNGLTDFVVVRTIEHLQQQDGIGLGLNFAVMRSVLAGERGDKLSLRVQRWFLLRMSDSMQIESLWKFNSKFDPDWVPRYAVYDSIENLLSSALAVARAESFVELPVIGRFFKPPEARNVEPLPGLPPAHEEPVPDEAPPVSVPPLIQVRHPEQVPSATTGSHNGDPASAVPARPVPTVVDEVSDRTS